VHIVFKDVWHFCVVIEVLVEALNLYIVSNKLYTDWILWIVQKIICRLQISVKTTDWGYLKILFNGEDFTSQFA